MHAQQTEGGGRGEVGGRGLSEERGRGRGVGGRVEVKQYF